MSSDVIALINSAGNDAIDQIIEDSGRMNIVINGTGTQSATTEDGSLIPSIRKAMLDNLYFKTPVLPWTPGTSVSVFNQLYSFTNTNGSVDWWYAPGATSSAPVTMQNSPLNDTRFRLFLNGSNVGSTYAPLNSPSFTGNPRVPTAAITDQSNTIANTQFVHDNIEQLRDEIGGAATGTFENVTATNTATTKNLVVSENTTLTGPVNASASEVTVGSQVVSGEAGEIKFELSGVPPTGIDLQTNLKPFGMTTGSFEANNSQTDSLVVSGPLMAATPAAEVQGLAEIDYLHITGNSSNESTRPQLIVEGIAQFGTVIADNLQANVDGLDIAPNSVSTIEGIEVGTSLNVGGDATIEGTTNVVNLNITGEVTGFNTGVDGEDIAPATVTTTGDINTGANLTAVGQLMGGSIVTTGSLVVAGSTNMNSLNTSDIITGEINVFGPIVAQRSTFRWSQQDSETFISGSVTSPFVPTLATNVINLEMDRDIVLGNIELTPGPAFNLRLYIRQDSTGGHTVTFDTGYLINGDVTEVSTDPNAVSIVYLEYSGYENDPVDVRIVVRS